MYRIKLLSWGYLNVLIPIGLKKYFEINSINFALVKKLNAISMSNKIIGALFSILSYFNLNAQDSATNLKSTIHLKAGIYQTEWQFIHNSPSILEPFSFKPFKAYSSYDDTVWVTFGYHFDDFSEEIRNVYGFCDGNETYIRLKEYEKVSDRHNTYFRVVRIGKYPFVTVLYNNKMNWSLTPELGSLVMTGVNNLYADDKTKIYYFDSKGRWLVTKKEMLYILKSESDLLKDFKSEKELDNKTFKKYLIKLNERYPS